MRVLSATVLASVLLSACASPPVAPDEAVGTRAARQEPAAENFGYALEHAFKLVSNDDAAEAYPILITLIASPSFDQLESERRHATLLVAGLVALELDKPAQAHPLLVRSSAMAEAGAEDWYGRLIAAHLPEQKSDAILSLTQLARHWPQKLQDLNNSFVVQVVNYARHVPNGQSALYDLLRGLFDAKWTFEDGIEPSDLWRELAAFELDRKQLAGAQEVISRVKAPHIIIALRADHRFDRLRQTVPQYFDVDVAVANEVEWLRSRVQRSPRSMDAIVQLTYALLNSGDYEEVLSITADVLSKSQATTGEPAPYDDMDHLIWIHDNRSRAFAATQRWNDAEAELQVAANMTESGKRNVSNIINLSWFYAQAGRSDEALSVLPDLGPEMSPYGLMQMHGARYAAALQKADMQIANESFEYLEKYRDDALSTWQLILVIGNRLDEAAAVLIKRLNDPVLRAEALQGLQDYANPKFAPQRALWDARLKQVRDREDVRRAINAVGRVESYKIPESET